MIEHSGSLASLAGAMAAAQGEIENAHKNAKNPHFRSNYADLAEIINTVRPVLSKHGLSVVQLPGYAEGVVTVDTMLMHKSGEWLRSTCGAPAQKMDPQGVGSAVTYLRRYSLAAVCGIAQEDDDGTAASQPPRQQEKPKVVAGGKATDKQITFLSKLANSSVFTEDEVARMAGAAESEDRERVSTAIEWAQKMIAERKAQQKETA